MGVDIMVGQAGGKHSVDVEDGGIDDEGGVLTRCRLTNPNKFRGRHRRAACRQHNGGDVMAALVDSKVGLAGDTTKKRFQNYRSFRRDSVCQ